MKDIDPKTTPLNALDILREFVTKHQSFDARALHLSIIDDALTQAGAPTERDGLGPPLQITERIAWLHTERGLSDARLVACRKVWQEKNDELQAAYTASAQSRDNYARELHDTKQALTNVKKRMDEVQKLYEEARGYFTDEKEQCTRLSEHAAKQWADIGRLTNELAAAKSIMQTIFDDAEGYADGAPDASPHAKLCNAIAGALWNYVEHNGQRQIEQAIKEGKLCTAAHLLKHGPSRPIPENTPTSEGEIVPPGKRVPLTFDDVPWGSVLRWKNDPTHEVSLSAKNYANVWVSSASTGQSYRELMAEMEIRRPGSTEWQPCSKLDAAK